MDTTFVCNVLQAQGNFQAEVKPRRRSKPGDRSGHDHASWQELEAAF